MTALVSGDNIEQFKFFPFRCIGNGASLQHGMQISPCFQNILKGFSDGMLPDHGGGCLTEHAGAVMMLQLGDIALIHPDLQGDPVAAGGIVRRFFRIWIINSAIASGISGKPQQTLLIKFINHGTNSCLLEGGKSVRRVDIGENAVLIGLDIEDMGFIFRNQ